MPTTSFFYNTIAGTPVIALWLTFTSRCTTPRNDEDSSRHRATAGCYYIRRSWRVRSCHHSESGWRLPCQCNRRICHGCQLVTATVLRSTGRDWVSTDALAVILIYVWLQVRYDSLNKSMKTLKQKLLRRNSNARFLLSLPRNWANFTGAAMLALTQASPQASSFKFEFDIARMRDVVEFFCSYNNLRRACTVVAILGAGMAAGIVTTVRTMPLRTKFGNTNYFLGGETTSKSRSVILGSYGDSTLA